MRLALAIVFLWAGGALMWLAFSGLSANGSKSEQLAGKPADLVTALQDKIASQGSAWVQQGG